MLKLSVDLDTSSTERFVRTNFYCWYMKFQFAVLFISLILKFSNFIDVENPKQM